MAEEQSDRPVPLEYARRLPKRKRWRMVVAALMSLSAAGLLVIILMPGRSYEIPPRVQCQSHLRQIGLGILLYANEHEGQYPDSLQTVAATEELTPNAFWCPGSNDNPSTAPTTQGQIADMLVPGHVSYIYIGKGLTSTTVLPNQVIVYEPLTNHAGDGMNVLLGDGHSEWVDKTRAMKILAAIKSTTQPVLLPP